MRRRLHVTGRVQGVFYRDWMASQARSLGIDGWVRNRADGSVEAVVEGTAEMIEALISRAHDGPPAARVERIEVEDDASGEVFEEFTKRTTR